MRRNRSLWVVAALVLVGLWAWTQRTDNGTLHSPQDAQPAVALPAGEPGFDDDRRPSQRPPPASVYPAFLPPEAHAVLDAIADGGPYEYRQDGGVFQNREGRLPRQPRGYYREFTVETPRSRDRGARRIVTGGEPPAEYFYTDDHYRSFRRFQLDRGRP
ncbi:MAG: ribonuclease domain-containing protein [Lysobacter sp.]